MEMDPAALAKALGYTFDDDSLLVAALTHASYIKSDGRRALHNERLEFLGDAVLELCISEYLYACCPNMREGEMTRARARLVCEEALFIAACTLKLPAYLRLGRGEKKSGGCEKPSIVSGALEAVIGAIYLDGGFDVVRKVVMEKIVLPLENTFTDAIDKDYKTRLQEFVQHERIGSLRYELMGATGPEHNKVFTMRVLLSEKEIGMGTGTNKQSAGQEAAKCALIALSVKTDGGNTFATDKT